MQASLAANPAFQVIEQPLRGSEQELCELHPDVIIFDIAAVQPEFHSIYTLAQKLPGLQLIGIDPDSNQVLVWAGRQFSALSIKDLFEVIQKDRPGNVAST
jgi:hypothetical protein